MAICVRLFKNLTKVSFLVFGKMDKSNQKKKMDVHETGKKNKTARSNFDVALWLDLEFPIFWSNAGDLRLQLEIRLQFREIHHIFEILENTYLNSDDLQLLFTM